MVYVGVPLEILLRDEFFSWVFTNWSKVAPRGWVFSCILNTWVGSSVLSLGKLEIRPKTRYFSTILTSSFPLTTSKNVEVFSSTFTDAIWSEKNSGRLVQSWTFFLRLLIFLSHLGAYLLIEGVGGGCGGGGGYLWAVVCEASWCSSSGPSPGPCFIIFQPLLAAAGGGGAAPARAAAGNAGRTISALSSCWAERDESWVSSDGQHDHRGQSPHHLSSLSSSWEPTSLLPASLPWLWLSSLPHHQHHQQISKWNTQSIL